jgi:hypothetical protein
MGREGAGRLPVRRLVPEPSPVARLRMIGGAARASPPFPTEEATE